jgi:hypothetical protein
MNDRGMLSVDFLAGFTIFILALIMVINMVPGIMIGLESQNIDYDAVAYRTAVILVEDPGWPANPPWELKDEYHKDDIDRMGLAVSDNTPNVLSRLKINRFFDDSFFTEEEYGQKVIFADLPYAPYAYNIALRVDGESPVQIGSDVPETSYGYIRRLVKVKEPHSAYIDCQNYNTSTTTANFTDTSISLVLNYTELYDKSISEAYRIDPRYEPVQFSIHNVSQSLFNKTDMLNARLLNVRFYKEGVLGEIPFGYDTFDNETYRFTIDGNATTLNHNESLKTITDIDMILEPPLPFAYETDTVLWVNFTLRYDFEHPPPPGDHQFIEGTVKYDYASSQVTKPVLTDGVLEVAVW